ncbi:hypothetical protein GALMADRAFT_134084 [Galerina marginata CBS 339.88]|uniref:Uncharacterized protein n=1 Tax=Galerina marginata (strain CBS 339.88) TaxID=685588 RepID=A0A067TU56_GALM3|nr:hypothetical protein GALMADRAFT_134084 [Galerina marginata CBS 339.88]
MASTALENTPAHLISIRYFSFNAPDKNATCQVSALCKKRPCSSLPPPLTKCLTLSFRTPVPSSSPEVAAETVEEMLLESLTPPVKSISTKKATISVISDSEIEIIETPAPLKKAKKVSKPAPASSEFEESPPEAGAAGAAKKLSLGAPGSEDDSSTAVAAKPASPVKVLGKCVSKPSAKAQCRKKESTPDPVSCDSDQTPPPPEGQCSQISQGARRALHQTLDSRRHSSATTQLLGKRLLPKKILKMRSHLLTSKATTKKTRIDAVEPDKSKGEGWSALTMKIFVFRKELPKGKKQAKHRPCSLLSFSSLINETQFRREATDLPSYLTLYRAVSKLLSQTGKENFERAFYFHSDGIIVKPAQASAHDAGVSPGRKCQAVADSNAVGLNRSNVKRIGIWLLNEEFDAMASYFGTVYITSQFYCHYFSDVIVFQTMKDGAGSAASGSAGGSSSPKKASSLFGSRSGEGTALGPALNFSILRVLLSQT